jgi:hypothetical protein
LIGDLTGKALLTSQGIDGDQQPVDRQCVEQFREGGDLIALAGDLFLAQRDAPFRREQHLPLRRILCQSLVAALAVTEPVLHHVEHVLDLRADAPPSR